MKQQTAIGDEWFSLVPTEVTFEGGVTSGHWSGFIRGYLRNRVCVENLNWILLYCESQYIVERTRKSWVKILIRFANHKCVGPVTLFQPN